MSARTSARLLLLCAGLALSFAAGCGSAPTELVLVVDTSLSVPGELDTVVIAVTGPTTTASKTATLGAGGTTLPLTLGLTHADGAALGPVTIVVTGQRASGDVVRRRVTTEFVQEQSKLLRVVLVASCLLPRDCGAGNTCSENGCVPEHIAGGALPDFGSVPGRFDGGSGAVERCNGVDDDGDTLIDEGFDLQHESANCGACGNDCGGKPGVGTAHCAAGVCVVDTCAADRGDCDTDGETGCESDLLTDAAHCNSCINTCQPLHGAPTCGAGACSIVCVPGFADCDDSPASGCEADLSAIDSCGRCANRCTTMCAAGYCDDQRVTSLTVGGSHGCALRASGAVVCWGGNASGQLGDGSVMTRRQPVDVRSLLDAREVVAGDSHTCALRASRAVVCWGEGGSGQLGEGSTMDRTTPVAVSTVTDATSLAAGGGHTCAVRAGATVACWGANNRGQLGDGSTSTRVSPVTVAGLANVSALVAGQAHTCALETDGSVVCWGANDQGQLGDGSADASSTSPRIVRGLANVTALATSANASHTCALTLSGEVYCWGDGASGQLGDGAMTDARAPVLAMLSASAQAVSVGSQHSCAALLDGTVRCWGANDQGQLGNGATLSSAAPVTVEGAASITVLGGGNKHSCAMTMTGAVYCWGWNLSGQVGDGSLSPSLPTATRVRTLPFP